MTPERMAELRTFDEKATPGPWEASKDHGGIYAPNKHDPSDPYFIGSASSNDTHAFLDNAAFIAAARTALPEALDVIERVRAIHKPFLIYGECEHEHTGDEPNVAYIDDIGYTCDLQYEICSACCTDGGYQSETCVDSHDHGAGKPICGTIAALDGKTDGH